ncbi:MAG TPA: carboxymuconolactone decarboxylase family protein [Acidimicrobiales bacterium]|nr:carboxymuconolactone decarboxylase family protein [Acidimicrobiales bacterium]
MLHGRLKWLGEGDLDVAQRELYKRILGGPRSKTPRTTPMTDNEGRMHGPFNAMLVDPVLGEATQQLGAVVRYGTKLDHRTREIAILEVARHHESEFEFYAHRAIGVASGLSEVELSAMQSGKDAESFSSRERLAREVVTSLVVRHDLDDELYLQAAAALGDVVLVDLVVLVGFYEYTALALRVFRVPLPDGVTPIFE